MTRTTFRAVVGIVAAGLLGSLAIGANAAPAPTATPLPYAAVRTAEPTLPPAMPGRQDNDPGPQIRFQSPNPNNLDVCVINATTWGPIATLLAQWTEQTDNEIEFSLRSAAVGCNDFPAGNRFMFSAYNDPADFTCARYSTSPSSGGRWTGLVTLEMNWGIPSCRDSGQIEINHRTGMYLGGTLGLPYTYYASDPDRKRIMNSTTWSIANIASPWDVDGEWAKLLD
jgi:hypothetical protein